MWPASVRSSPQRRAARADRRATTTASATGSWPRAPRRRRVARRRAPPPTSASAAACRSPTSRLPTMPWRPGSPSTRRRRRCWFSAPPRARRPDPAGSVRPGCRSRVGGHRPADLAGAGVVHEPLSACQRGQRRRQRRRGLRRELDHLLGAQERRGREARREAAVPARRQDVVGAGDVVAVGRPAVGPDEDRAGMVDRLERLARGRRPSAGGARGHRRSRTRAPSRGCRTGSPRRRSRRGAAARSPRGRRDRATRAPTATRGRAPPARAGRGRQLRAAPTRRRRRPARSGRPATRSRPRRRDAASPPRRRRSQARRPCPRPGCDGRAEREAPPPPGRRRPRRPPRRPGARTRPARRRAGARTGPGGEQTAISGTPATWAGHDRHHGARRVGGEAAGDVDADPPHRHLAGSTRPARGGSVTRVGRGILSVGDGAEVLGQKLERGAHVGVELGERLAQSARGDPRPLDVDAVQAQRQPADRLVAAVPAPCRRCRRPSSARPRAAPCDGRSARTSSPTSAAATRLRSLTPRSVSVGRRDRVI